MKVMPDATLQTSLVLENFFSGPIRAEGVFTNAWSRSQRGISIDMLPSWDGKVLLLDERFVYSDGKTEHKVWRLEKTGPGTYIGSREDMIGTGRVWTEGRNVRLNYVLVLAGIGLNFDETMTLREDGTVLGRSTVKKWGILIGRVELAMRRV
jgi:hypothetical protein